MAHGEAVRQFRKHPGMAFINEQGIPEPPLAIHMSNSLCREKLGLPGAYEVGLQRTGWIVHMLTNWAGDAGWVRRLEHDYNAFIIRGDTTWCHGEVIGKHENEPVVECRVWTINQQDEVTCTGTAEIVLPTRGAEQA